MSHVCFNISLFSYSWKLTLVLVAISPFIAVAAILQGKLLALGAGKSAVANQQVSSLAIEVCLCACVFVCLFFFFLFGRKNLFLISFV